MNAGVKSVLACLILGTLFTGCYAREERPYRPGQDARELNNQAVYALRVGNYEEALAKATKATEIEPEFDAAHANRAAILSALGRYDEAVAALQTVIRLRPDSAGAYVPLGLLLERAGRKEEAKAQYEAAVALYDARLAKNPGDTDAAVERATALYLKGEERTALLALKKVLADHPECDAAKTLRQRIEKGSRGDFVAGMDPPPDSGQNRLKSDANLLR